MLDRIIQSSLRNRLITLFAALMLLGGGAYAALTMPVDVFPSLTAPTVTVLTESHGMAPEEVERLVTFPVETAVNGSAGVRRVRSSSAQGISIVWVEFEWGTDIYRARQIVSEKLQLVGVQLPPEVSRPVLAPITSIMGEILLIGVNSDRHSPMEVRSAADGTIRRRLLSVPGVAQVVPMGGAVKQYQVLADPERMRGYDVSLQEVIAAAEGSNHNASGGVYQEDGEEILIRGIGRVQNVEEIRQTVVKTVDGSPVQLFDVADVRVGPQPKIGTAAVNGESAVVLSIQKQPGANTLDLSERIDAELDQIEAQLPEGMQINRSIYRQADFISLAVNNVIEALRDGAFLVVIILFLFLWSIRTTVISVLAIPLSLAVALLLMKGLGITINTMTLGGMAIAIGALVDDAIITVENVFRRLRLSWQQPPDERASTLEVVYEGSKQVLAPIMNATFIIVIVFVPLFFLSGIEGRMLRPLGFAYIVSILASLLVAVSVTPVLCAYLLPGSPAIESTDDSWLVEHLKSAYRRTLDTIFRWPKTVMAGAALLVAAAILVTPMLGRGFLPEFQEGTLTISAVTLPGTGINTSDQIGRRIEKRLLEHPAVTGTSRRTGRAELSEHAQGSNASEIDAALDLSEHELGEVMRELRVDLSGISGTNITIGQPIGHRIDHMLSGTRAAIAIKLFGPNLQQLRTLGEQVRTAVSDVPGTADLAVEQQADVPQVRIRADRTAMAKYGVTPGHLSETVDVAYNGEVVSQVLEGQQTFDLVVRFGEEHRGSVERIKRGLVDTPMGPKVPFSQLAEVYRERGPNRISREDVQRKIVIQSNVAGRDVGSVVDDIQQQIRSEVDLPQGYFIEYGGQFRSAREATRRIGLLSLVAILAIFLLLFQEFGESRSALLVMVNLPLALTGGVFALLITRYTLNIAALVGFVTLFGIAVRNGILLVSLYQDLRREGKSIRDAVVQGSMERLNPILMTALTAGLALIPLALGGGEAGKEIQTPLAIVVIGGLLTSTFLNMVVVPTLYIRYGPEVVPEEGRGL